MFHIQNTDYCGVDNSCHCNGCELFLYHICFGKQSLHILLCDIFSIIAGYQWSLVQTCSGYFGFGYLHCLGGIFCECLF